MSSRERWARARGGARAVFVRGARLQVLVQKLAEIAVLRQAAARQVPRRTRAGAVWDCGGALCSAGRCCEAPAARYPACGMQLSQHMQCALRRITLATPGDGRTQTRSHGPTLGTHTWPWCIGLGALALCSSTPRPANIVSCSRHWRGGTRSCTHTIGDGAPRSPRHAYICCCTRLASAELGDPGCSPASGCTSRQSGTSRVG